MTKLINAIRNFTHAPKNYCQTIYSTLSKEHGPSLELNQPRIHTGIKTAYSYIQGFQHIRFSINTIRFVNRLKSLVKQTDTWIGTKCKPCDRPATGFPLYWVRISSLCNGTLVVWSCAEQAYLAHPNLPGFRGTSSIIMIRHHYKFSITLIINRFTLALSPMVGFENVVGLTARYGLDGTGIVFRWVEIFSSYSDRPWDWPSLLYNGCWTIPVIKRLGRGAEYHPSSSLLT